MIQEALEIVDMLIVDVMPEITNIADAVPLSDEVSYFFGLIRFVTFAHRVLVTGKRVASRIQARRSSGECSAGEQQHS